MLLVAELRAGRPIQSSPQNRFPAQPFRSPNTCSSGKLRFLRPRTPNSSCAAPSKTSCGLFPQGPPQPRTPASSVLSPVCTPKGPSPSPLPQATLQTPIVTNHLVRLVTAASRTPQQPTCTSTRAKMRRFPGPAGLLPHQVSDSFALARARAPQAAPRAAGEQPGVSQPCPIPEDLQSQRKWRKEGQGLGAFQSCGRSQKWGELKA